MRQIAGGSQSGLRKFLQQGRPLSLSLFLTLSFTLSHSLFHNLLKLVLWIRNDYSGSSSDLLRVRLGKSSGSDLNFFKHVLILKMPNSHSKWRINQRFFHFYLDPDQKQIIQDPGKSFRSNWIRIHNSIVYIVHQRCLRNKGIERKFPVKLTKFF